MADDITAAERIDKLYDERAKLARAPGPWVATLHHHPLRQTELVTSVKCCTTGHSDRDDAYRCAVIEWRLSEKRTVEQAEGLVAYYVTLNPREVAQAKERP